MLGTLLNVKAKPNFDYSAFSHGAFVLAFRKKVEAVAKLKDCELVGQWRKSLVNHLYWCTVSTPSGNGDEIKAKWISMNNHIHNIHHGHGEIYPSCTHGPLTGRSRKKKWFKPGEY